jgi:hypothetical protein
MHIISICMERERCTKNHVTSIYCEHKDLPKRVHSLHINNCLERREVTNYIFSVDASRKHGTLPVLPSNSDVHLPLHISFRWGHVVAYLVEALCCKPEGRGFDSQ